MELFNKMVRNDISPNEFYMLYCMRESVQPLRINYHKELRMLQDEGWVGEDLKLQPKAEELLSDVEVFFKLNKKKTTAQILGSDFQANLTKYNELFPRKKAGSGKYMRSNPKNVETNFRWFFENYKYSWEIILEATSRYLIQEQNNNYKFTRTSMYFIQKRDKGVVNSDLADWCEMVTGGIDDDEERHFKEKVV